MKILVSDTEVDIEVEEGEYIEWVSQGGNHLHAKLARREYHMPPTYTYDPCATVDDPGMATTAAPRFDGVTTGMKLK